MHTVARIHLVFQFFGDQAVLNFNLLTLGVMAIWNGEKSKLDRVLYRLYSNGAPKVGGYCQTSVEE